MKNYQDPFDFGHDLHEVCAKKWSRDIANAITSEIEPCFFGNEDYVENVFEKIAKTDDHKELIKKLRKLYQKIVPRNPDGSSALYD